eukprot:CAMPEP_0198114952 /NCGR_PEP_ID=MMETSP1442-20131203/6181_1 /TAXON_ID= /ORGANISM="Craspedostauros australis, Strain CCMP3328" /LENGTH=123 /DNA_ID=CAMNT_0043772363 /DNA_START=95 /DNA_END=463 /DNA_ORIENTATION=+
MESRSFGNYERRGEPCDNPGMFLLALLLLLISAVAAALHGAEALRFLVHADGFLSRLSPLLDALVLAVQQQELPSLKEAWEQVKARRDAKQGHQWEDDGDRLQVLHQEHQSEEADLKDGVHVD